MNLEEKSDEIVKRVANKLMFRSAVGIEKYNSTIWDNTDENYIKHLQEELLDGANYCEQIFRLGEFTKNVIELIDNQRNDQLMGAEIRKLYNKFKEENDRR